MQRYPRIIQIIKVIQDQFHSEMSLFTFALFILFRHMNTVSADLILTST